MKKLFPGFICCGMGETVRAGKADKSSMVVDRRKDFLCMLCLTEDGIDFFQVTRLVLFEPFSYASLTPETQNV